MKCSLEKHDDGLEDHERSEGEAVCTTGVFFAGNCIFRNVLPEVDDIGAGREVEDGAAKGEESVLKVKFPSVDNIAKVAETLEVLGVDATMSCAMAASIVVDVNVCLTPWSWLRLLKCWSFFVTSQAQANY